VETKCGASWYNASNANLDCQSSIVVTKCGTNWYNAASANLDCQSSVVVTKCGTAWYNAANQRCVANNVIETQCGSGWYNAANVNLRCNSGAVVDTKCGTSWYDAANTNLRCQSDVVETKCGTGSTYHNPATEQCCGNSKYNVATQFCHSGTTVLPLCGGQEYAGMEYCSNGIKKTYRTVVIGTQTWMAENLNYDAEGSKCYNNLESNCSEYGRLYNWKAAMNFPATCVSTSTCLSQIQSKHKGICPEGWHIPSQSEWDALSSYVENDNQCNGCDAKHLKSQEGWNFCGPSGSGKPYLCEDTYGFSALPGGSSFYAYDDFRDIGVHHHWWSATTNDGSSIYTRTMSGHFESAYEDDHRGAGALYGVRCLQD
jgi:uncharacterized protein (TIGR02145 family)